MHTFLDLRAKQTYLGPEESFKQVKIFIRVINMTCSPAWWLTPVVPALAGEAKAGGSLEASTKPAWTM